MTRWVSDSPDYASEFLKRLVTRDHLTEWASHVLAPAGQVPAAHHRLLMQKLESVACGEIDRLMVLMPPGSAKSTYASIIFPALVVRPAPGQFGHCSVPHRRSRGAFQPAGA